MLEINALKLQNHYEESHGKHWAVDYWFRLSKCYESLMEHPCRDGIVAEVRELYDDNKFSAVKALKDALLHHGLRECKDIVESLCGNPPNYIILTEP